jgi:glycosyltransferase involved in cell wall biosynthesis
LGGGDLVASAFPTADALAPLYTNADVFVLPSRYEGYGMVFAEAITHGLPIVATQAGAIPELVPTSAGVLVPIDDPIALAEALRRVILEPDLRSSLAAGARAAAAQLPCWHDSAGLIASALSQLQS